MKRYRLVRYGYECGCEMEEENELGEYVKYEDHVKELQRISDTPVLSAVPSDEKLTLNDLDGKTILVKFSVQKGKLKVYPEEFDLE